jgi:3-oxoacyl-[acyl-carrier protein] reductase
MKLAIEGRVALITGGGGALGTAMALALAQEGASVAVLDLNASAAETAAATLKQQGFQALPLHADITIKSEVSAAVSAVEQSIGAVDILVNNAGFSRDRYLTKMEEADWDIVHGVVLKGAFHCCRAVLPAMMDRRFGRIVNVSSMAYKGNPGQTNYSSAKAGLIGMTASLAKEAGPFNITCNAIAPGLVATPRLRARPDFEKLEQRSRAVTPLPRLAEPEDIAKTVVFFASSLADFVSGQTLHVTGGS